MTPTQTGAPLSSLVLDIRTLASSSPVVSRPGYAYWHVAVRLCPPVTEQDGNFTVFTSHDPAGELVAQIGIATIDLDGPDDPRELFNSDPDLERFGDALLNARTGKLHHKVSEFAGPHRVLILDTVEVCSRWRGANLGPLLAGTAMLRLSRGATLAVTQLGPREYRGPRLEGMRKLRDMWATLGFHPYYRGVYILDLRSPALAEGVAHLAAQFAITQQGPQRVPTPRTPDTDEGTSPLPAAPTAIAPSRTQVLSTADMPIPFLSDQECHAAAPLLADVVMPPNVPAVLGRLWRTRAELNVACAQTRERYYGVQGLVAEAVAASQLDLNSLLPDAPQIAEALATGTPVVIAGGPYWAPGWDRFINGPRAAAPAPPEAELRELRAALLVEVDLIRRAPHIASTAAEVNARFAEVALAWVETTVLPRLPGAQVHRRLWIPLERVPGLFAHLSLAVLVPGGPDLVMVFAQGNTALLRREVAFAAESGAHVVWVRWYGGVVFESPGVSLLDLIDDTRALVRR